METMLTYAVPVHVAELGANLQAWIDTLRAVQSLRLCHRVGRGNTAALTRLPTELLARIESCLVNAVRQQSRPEWGLDLRCYENVCTPLEHFSWDEQILIYAKNGIQDQEMGTNTTVTPYGPRTTLELNGDGRPIQSEPPQREAVDARLMELLNERGSRLRKLTTDIHQERRHAWRQRIRGHFTRRTEIRTLGFFEKYHAHIENHLGSRIWISNVRSPSNSRDLVDIRETTVTYLTMPHNRVRRERWKLMHDEDVPGCESGYGMPVKFAEPPSTKSLQRFSRALQILGLEAYVHPGQIGRILAPPTLLRVKDERECAYDTTSWPQLTLLTRNKPHK